MTRRKSNSLKYQGVQNILDSPQSTYFQIYLREPKIRSYYPSRCLVFTSRCSYYSSDEIPYILAKPLRDSRFEPALGTGVFQQEVVQIDKPFHFIFTDLTEAFSTQIQVPLFITFYLLIPLLSYQFWLFTKPGSYLYEKDILKSLLITSLILSFSNLSLTYLSSIPGACKPSTSPEMPVPCAYDDGSWNNRGPFINPEARISTHVDLTTALIFRCHLFLQLPVLTLACIKIGIIPETSLIGPKKRKICYLIRIFISALISPVSQLMLLILIPTLLSYELLTYFISMRLRGN